MLWWRGTLGMGYGEWYTLCGGMMQTFSRRP